MFANNISQYNELGIDSKKYNKRVSELNPKLQAKINII